MFPDRYFAPRYFAPRFWPGGAAALTTVAVLPVRVAFHDRLGLVMAYLHERVIGLAFGDLVEIVLNDADLVAVVLSYEVRAHLEMTVDDVIGIWMNED